MSAVREVVEGQTVHRFSHESPGEMVGGPSADLPLALSWLSDAKFGFGFTRERHII